MVGREDDARALRRALEAALGGAGRVVALLGEAGMGKSRLAVEVANEARTHCTVLTGRAVPGPGSTGLRAFADALHPAFRARRPPDADEIRPFVAALARLVPDWRTEAVAAPSDPVIVGEGVLRLLRLLAGPTACLLVLEDLHWADAETLAVLEYLADHVASEPVLCVLTCRTDEHSPGGDAIQQLVDRRSVEAIRLARLNEADAIVMAQACLASAEIPSELADLVSRAEGIPFVVEELLASAVAVGALVREGTSWRLDPSGQQQHVAVYNRFRPASGTRLRHKASPVGIRPIALVEMRRFPEAEVLRRGFRLVELDAQAWQVRNRKPVAL
jgi:hypothetical protein